MFYELASDTWGDEERAAAHRVIDGGRYTMGEEVAAFEREFAQKIGSRHSVMVSSGSAANLVAVAALFYRKNNPLRPGDEVIVPAVSWATTYYPLQQYGLKPVFVDVELDSLNMDVSKLNAALSPRTRMLVAVSILGNPCALDEMRLFCDKNGLIFFEDNCESLGATLNGKNAGTFGDVGTFSTFFSHHISTMEGGLIATDDEELYQLCRSMRAHGWTRDVTRPDLLYQTRENDRFEDYRFILPGYNARPLEISGAIGREQLKKLDPMIQQRRKNAALFKELFSGDDRFITQRERGESSWFSFTFVLNPEYRIDRTKVVTALKERDIAFRMVTGGCFLRHDVIKYFDYRCVDPIVNANLVHDHGFFVGNHPRDLSKQIHALREALNQVT